MNTLTLIQTLQHSQWQERLNAARILGMLDEVDALPPLTRAFKRETDSQVILVMVWAGKRLQAAKANGYNTFEQLWKHYHMEREVSAEKDETPYFGLDPHEMEMLYEQSKSQRRANQIQRRLYGISFSASKDSSLNAGGLEPTLTHREGDTKRRAMPVEPTSTEIRPHVQRLLHHQDPQVRRKAAITLGDINNPSALSALAHTFMNDAVEEVRAASQHFGKRIYWNLLYWEMEHDGTIKQEIERRRSKSEKPITDPDAAQKKAIEDVLRRGMEKRRKR
jgi:HEAT repeat protein